MKLLIDIGNSRLKWAFSTPAGLSAPGEAPLGDPVALLPLLESSHVLDEIRMANVAGADIGAEIADQLVRRFGLQPVVAVSAACGAGVANGYRQPQQLGVDRWLAMCAAYSRYRSAVWVVDAGTATTLDQVTTEGEHRGGLILPGLELMQSMLFRRTGDLARLAGAGQTSPSAASMDPRPGGLGRDTATAIRTGAFQATVSVIVRYLSTGCDRLAGGADEARLVVTGGLGGVLLAALEHPTGDDRADEEWNRRLVHRPQLVLEGLALDPPCFAAAR